MAILFNPLAQVEQKKRASVSSPIVMIEHTIKSDKTCDVNRGDVSLLCSLIQQFIQTCEIYIQTSACEEAQKTK